MVAGSARRLGLRLEAEAGQIKIIDEDIDHADRTVFGYVVIEAFGKQRGLMAILSLNESAHRCPFSGKHDYIRVFTQPGSEAESSKSGMAYSGIGQKRPHAGQSILRAPLESSLPLNGSDRTAFHPQPTFKTAAASLESKLASWYVPIFGLPKIRAWGEMMRMSGMIAALALLSSAAAVAETLALTNARIIDGTGSPPQPDRTILIEDGFIRGVFREGEGSLPGGATAVDIGGRIVLPGLIDGHVHLSRNRRYSSRQKEVEGTVQPEDREAALAALLRSGVTSVRELAGDARLSGELAQRQLRGEIEAPRIYYSAVLYGPAFLEDPRVQGSQRGMAPGTAPWSRAVTADSDIAEIVAEARVAGVTGIKLYASLDAPLLTALTAEAHRQGMKAWAHSVIFPASPSEVVSAGVDSLTHSRGLIAEGRADVPDTFEEGIAWISQLDFEGTDPQAPRFKQLFSEMKRHGVLFEPALHADGDPAKGPTGDWRDDMRVWSCKITDAAHRAGVTISAGTDTPAARSGALQREMERLVECGMSPLEAIRAATLNNAKALGMEGIYGTVETGKAADLLIVNGDPAAEISTVSNVHMVIQGGRIIIGPDRLE